MLTLCAFGRPDGEVHAVDAVDRAELRPELVVASVVPALAEQVEIEIGQLRLEGVGIVGRDHLSVFSCNAQLVTRVEIRCSGRIASYNPAGWIRRMGRETGCVLRSITQACSAVGKKARTDTALLAFHVRPRAARATRKDSHGWLQPTLPRLPAAPSFSRLSSRATGITDRMILQNSSASVAA